MDDYDDEPVSIPTFSTGNIPSRVSRSRTAASTSAMLSALRASANMIQQIPKGKIITSSSISKLNKPLPLRNANLILAAQQRSDNLIKHMQQFPQNTPPSLHRPIITHVIPTPPPPPPPPPIKKIINIPEVPQTNIVYARNIKKELLISLPKNIPLVKKQYGPIKYIQHHTLLKDTPLHQEYFDTLCGNLLNLLKDNSSNLILNEFKIYETKARISLEETLHYNAVQSAFIHKKNYLNSDA